MPLFSSGKEIIMKALALKTYRITDIQFQNHAVANGKTKLETKYTYQVKFGNNNTCRAEIRSQ